MPVAGKECHDPWHVKADEPVVEVADENSSRVVMIHCMCQVNLITIRAKMSEQESFPKTHYADGF